MVIPGVMISIAVVATVVLPIVEAPRMEMPRVRVPMDTLRNYANFVEINASSIPDMGSHVDLKLALALFCSHSAAEKS
jgi:hypothetical protein